MKKIFTIGLKDLRLTFRDRGALIMMLLAPYLLTLGLGFVTGAFDDDGDAGGLRDIPMQVINLDDGDLGPNLVDVFMSDDLADLLLVEESADIDAARQLVDDDELAAVVIIPTGFSAKLLPNRDTGEVQDGPPIEIYSNPSRPISASVIEAIVTEFVNQVDSGAALVIITIEQLITSGQLTFDDANSVDLAQLPPVLQQLTAPSDEDNTGLASSSLIQIRETVGATQDEASFDVLTVLVPGMALFFLMYTVTLGGRGILMERLDGTLARMQTTPTSVAEILGGKIVGVILIGMAQVTILVVASTILYGINWGDGFAVAALIISAAVAATGWGILFASSARTPEQVTAIGTAVMLVFGAISGTFAQVDSPFLRSLGRITPNQWALDGFTALGLGDSLTDILPNIAALWVMAILLFIVSIVLFRRNLA